MLNLQSNTIEDKLQPLIGLHKSLLMKLSREYREKGKFEEKTIKSVDISGKEIALIFSGFKCSHRLCNKEENLQYHHLITRNYKHYLPYHVYLTQRRYWANIIVTCKDCHLKLHEWDKITPKPEDCISEKIIKKLKKKWGPKQSSNNGKK